jgi:hypothetical protein
MPQADHRDRVGLGTGNDERQILVLLIEAMKQSELLRTVRRVVDCVQIEGERQRRLGERGDELIDERFTKLLQRGDVDLVLEAGQRRLAGQVGIVGRAIGNELEDRIGPQGIVIVLVFVTGQNAEDAHANHFEERVLDVLLIAWVVEGGSELGGQADAFVELSQRQQTSIGGERVVGNLNLDWSRAKEI